jgi:protein-L-isoaspartate O-methyltransferase
VSARIEQEEGWSALGRSLLDTGALTPDWAPVFAAVPRSAFLPELMWPFDMATRTSVPVSRSAEPAAWQAHAEANVPIVTQWDDGDHAGTAPGRRSTSSASMPSVVAAMLAELDVRSGHKVLEIGTGTGWNAGLLAGRLGDAHVTTVEVDPAVADAARASLRRAGLAPAVITADGLEGHPAGMPYHRIIATCGVREIPYAWIAQTKPGGLILAPWGTRYCNSDAVVRLSVAAGAGSGRFVRPVEFMKVRGGREAAVRHGDYVPPQGTDAADRGSTTVTAEEFFDAPSFTLGLRVGNCVRLAAEKRGDTRPVWFYGIGDRSWAVVVFRDGRPESVVHQSGPRRLWDEVEEAFRWWTAQGRPALDRFGLTVGPAGQSVWLDDPGQCWGV